MKRSSGTAAAICGAAISMAVDPSSTNAGRSPWATLRAARAGTATTTAGMSKRLLMANTIGTMSTKRHVEATADGEHDRHDEHEADGEKRVDLRKRYQGNKNRDGCEDDPDGHRTATPYVVGQDYRSLAFARGGIMPWCIEIAVLAPPAESTGG